jgi:hypothetical protein
MIGKPPELGGDTLQYIPFGTVAHVARERFAIFSALPVSAWRRHADMLRAVGRSQQSHNGLKPTTQKEP